MQLLKIDALSLSELQHIAMQEGMEDWEQLDRDDLIDALEDWFEEQQEDAKQSAHVQQIRQRRYQNSLAGYRGNSKPERDINCSLPEFYSETAIRILLRDPTWLYAYWSISTLDSARLKEAYEEYHLILRVATYEYKTDTEIDYFDIIVGEQDNDRNISLPALGKSYRISLLCRGVDEEHQELLCQSERITTDDSWWLHHSEELNQNSELFRMLFSSVVTAGGTLIDNQILKELTEKLSAGGEG